MDDWRYQRRAALVTGGFKKGTTETQIYSLPFDDELGGGKNEGYDIEAFYNENIGRLN